MNISISGISAARTNTQALKMVGANNLTANKKSEDKKDNQNSTAAVLTISNNTSKDRSKAITMRHQSMKDTLQKQIEALNERLQKASEQGNTALEEQLTEGIKELRDDYSALDEQLSTALFEEQQRQAEEAKKKEEDAIKEREKKQEEFKPDDEKIEREERQAFEFLAKSDIATTSIQNSKLQKAKLERTKGRLEGEMAIDGAAKADREQLQKARASELNNKNGFSYVPYVSDKTILTEKKRIASRSFTPDENFSVNELNKLNNGIGNLERSIGSGILELNEAVSERTEDKKDSAKLEKTSQDEAVDVTIIDEDLDDSQSADSEN